MVQYVNKILQLNSISKYARGLLSVFTLAN